jgi:hypothetical protein
LYTGDVVVACGEIDHAPLTLLSVSANLKVVPVEVSQIPNEDILVDKLSHEIRTLVAERLATGKYATENDVLLQALHRLREYDDTVADVQEGIDDEAAGRIRPLTEADAEIRRNLGFAK